MSSCSFHAACEPELMPTFPHHRNKRAALPAESSLKRSKVWQTWGPRDILCTRRALFVSCYQRKDILKYEQTQFRAVEAKLAHTSVLSISITIYESRKSHIRFLVHGNEDKVALTCGCFVLLIFWFLTWKQRKWRKNSEESACNLKRNNKQPCSDLGFRCCNLRLVKVSLT